MRGVEYEDIAPEIVFARDKRRCQICGAKTRGKYPAPTSATIDHIVPLAKGGPHLLHNVQTACLRCNLKKHVGAANDQMRLAV
jgi:5-methylcytosine-specific restriction endonuclease McrA